MFKKLFLLIALILCTASPAKAEKTLIIKNMTATKLNIVQSCETCEFSDESEIAAGQTRKIVYFLPNIPGIRYSLEIKKQGDKEGLKFRIPPQYDFSEFIITSSDPIGVTPRFLNNKEKAE